MDTPESADLHPIGLSPLLSLEDVTAFVSELADNVEIFCNEFKIISNAGTLLDLFLLRNLRYPYFSNISDLGLMELTPEIEITLNFEKRLFNSLYSLRRKGFLNVLMVAHGSTF